MASPPLSLDHLLKQYESPKPNPARFYNEPQFQRLLRIVHLHIGVVCQVQTPTDKGTGCLIGGNLLITNHHVILDAKTAATSHALFFRVISQDVDKKNTTVKILRLKLDPSRFYYASPQKKEGNTVLAADAENLDFAIVALEPDPYLEEVKDRVFSIFNKIEPEMNSLTCILQHPDVIDSKTSLQGDLKWSMGLALRREDCSIHYDTETAPGSSGGAVMDEKGNLIALHYQGLNNCGCNPSHPNCNSGVLMTEIAHHLETKGARAKIEEKITNYHKENPSKVACFIEALKAYYKSLNKIPLLFCEDKKLNIQNYAPLIIIDQKEKKQKREDSSKKDFKEGKLIYEASFRARPLDLETLLEKDGLKDAKEKRVLILGGAGSGKSTLIQYIAYQWAMGELWSQFTAIFFVELRRLNREFYPGNTFTAFDLLAMRGFSFDGYKSLLEDENFRQKTLLILEGYDELSPDAERGYLGEKFQELKNLFPHILITSRYQRVPYGEVKNCIFEILGFGATSIGQFVTAFFQSFKNKYVAREQNLRAYLQNPMILSLAHIPLNLAILCWLFKEMENPFDKEKYLTISRLYEGITDWLCKHFLLRPGVCRGQKADIIDDPNPINQAAPIVRALQELAWEAMKMNKYSLSEEEIKSSFGKVSLAISDNKNFGIFKIDRKSGSFIHPTFQEYFAGRYLADLYLNGQIDKGKEFIAAHKFSALFFPVFWMAAGYLSSKGNEVLKLFFDHLLSEPYDLAISYELRLLARCFEECKNPEALPRYNDFIQDVIVYLNGNALESAKVNLILGNSRLLGHDEMIKFFDSAFKNNEKRDKALSLLRTLAQQRQFIPHGILEKIIDLLKQPEISWDAGFFVFDILEEMAKGEQATSKEALDALIKIAKDSDHATLSNFAIFSLGSVAESQSTLSKDALDAIITLLENPPGGEGGPSVNALIRVAKSRNSHSKKVLDILFKVIKDPTMDGFDYRETRKETALALGQLARSRRALSNEALSILIALLTDPTVDDEAKGYIALALGHVAKSRKPVSQKALNALIAFISNLKKDDHIRRYIAKVIGEAATYGDALSEAVQETLATFLNDPEAGPTEDYFSEEEIKTAQVLSQEDFNVLIGLLESPKTHLDVKCSVIFALERVAISEHDFSKPALDVLRKISWNYDVVFDVRYKAGEVVERVTNSQEALVKILDPKADFDSQISAFKTLEYMLYRNLPTLPKGIWGALVALYPKADYSTKSSITYFLSEAVKKGIKLSTEVLTRLIAFLKDPKLASEISSIDRVLKEAAKSRHALPKEVLDRLNAILRDFEADSLVRCSVVEILKEATEAGDILSEETLEALISILKDPKVDSIVKSSSARALRDAVKNGQVLTQKAQNMLIEVFKDLGAEFIEVDILDRIAETCSKSFKRYEYSILSRLFYLTGRPFFYHDQKGEFYTSEKTPLITGSLVDRQKVYQEFLQESKLHPKTV